MKKEQEPKVSNVRATRRSLRHQVRCNPVKNTIFLNDIQSNVKQQSQFPQEFLSLIGKKAFVSCEDILNMNFISRNPEKQWKIIQEHVNAMNAEWSQIQSTNKISQKNQYEPQINLSKGYIQQFDQQ